MNDEIIGHSDIPSISESRLNQTDVNLSRRQEQIYAILYKKSPPAADMYFNALTISQLRLFPRWEMCAALLLRELITGLPKHLNVISTTKYVLHDEWTPVSDQYEKCKRKAARNGGTHEFEDLEALFSEVHTFSQAYSEAKPKQRTANAAVLKALHWRGEYIEGQVLEEEGILLTSVYEGLNGLVHGGERVKFEDILAVFEDLLHRTMIPRTIANLSRIDEILKGSQDAE